jgi:hypothetical protein
MSTTTSRVFFGLAIVFVILAVVSAANGASDFLDIPILHGVGGFYFGIAFTLLFMASLGLSFATAPS